MSSIKQQEMKATLAKDEKTATILNKSFQALLKNEKGIHDTDFQLATNFQAIGENETTPNMKKLFNETSTSLKTINISHQKYVSSLESKILPSTVSYTNEIKTMKQQLSDYEKKFLAEQKVEISISSQKNPADASKSQQLQKKYEDAKKETEKSQQALVAKMKTYAFERNLEMKALLQHFIHAQMVYHASALENLTSMSQKVQIFEEEAESKILIDKLMDERGGGNKNMEMEIKK